MEIALGIAIGSSTQIAVLAVPACVIMGWAMGQPFSLDFKAYETVTVCILLPPGFRTGCCRTG